MDELERLLDLLAKDGSIEQRLQTFWPVIEPRLSAIVGRLRTFASGLAAADGAEPVALVRLERVHLRHFSHLLSWRVDGDYADSVLAMQFAFQRANLGAPEIVAIYNELARSLTTYLVEAYRWTPGTLASIQKAVTSAVLFDLSMILANCRAENRIAPAALRPPAPAVQKDRLPGVF